MNAIMIKVVSAATGGCDALTVYTDMTLKQAAEAAWLGIHTNSPGVSYTANGRTTHCGDLNLCDFGIANGSILTVSDG